jgi:hypothetical protein
MLKHYKLPLDPETYGKVWNITVLDVHLEGYLGFCDSIGVLDLAEVN